MYGKQRFWANNLVTSETMLTASSQATGRVSGVSTQAAGSAVWSSSGAYSGARDLLTTIQIDSISAGAEVGSATYAWKTNETVTGWEATGVTTSTTPTALGSDAKMIAWESGSGADFAVDDVGVFWCYAPFGPGKTLDLDRNTYWQSTGDSSENIVVDLGSAQAVTAFLIGDHNLTAGATITLQANSSNSWGSPAYSQVVTVQDPAYLYLSQTYRYWRVLLADASNPDGYIKIGELYIGTYTELAAEIARPLWGSQINIIKRLVETQAETGRRSQRIWSTQQEYELRYETLDATDTATLKGIWESTFDSTTTGEMWPLFVHYFYDEADTLKLCHCVSGFDLKYSRGGINSVSIKFEEVAKTRL